MSSANARGPIWEDGIYRVSDDDDDDPSEAATRVGEFDHANVQAMMGLAAANVRTASSVPPKRAPIPREETQLMPAAPSQRSQDVAPVSRVVAKAAQHVGDNALAALDELSAKPAPPPPSPLAQIRPPHDVQIRVVPDAIGFAATIPATWTPAPLVPPRPRRSRALIALAVAGVLLAIAVPLALVLLRA
jgi:hypothetical protein